MKYLSLLLVSYGLLSLSSSLFAQSSASVVTLWEESTTGSYRDTIPAGGIVDINSIIRIRVNRTEIEEQLFEMAGIPDSSERLQQLRQLNELLSHEATIVQMLNDIRSNPTASLQAYANWAAFEEQYKDILRVSDPDLYQEIYDRIDNFEFGDFDEDKTDAEFIVYVVQQKADSMREELTQAFGYDAQNQDSSLLVYFRLGAFLKNQSGGRALHVENFDTYEPGEFSEIERFGTPPPVSEAENAEIAKSVELANQMLESNESMMESFQRRIKEAPDQLLSSKPVFEEVLAGVKSLRERVKNQELNLKIDLSLRLDENANKLDLVRDAYAFVSTNLSQPLTPESFLSISEELGNKLDLSITQAQTDFQSLSKQAKDENADPTTLEQLDQLTQQYDGLRTSIQTDIANLKRYFEDARGLFSLFKKSYVETEEFAEEVKRFQPGNIPQEGFIELKYIGERKPGNEILIKAIMERGTNPKAPNYEQREVYRRYISMRRVSAHVKMSGSLVLANPYNKANNLNVTIPNSYQFAPAYSIFLKWGSRKSHFFNDFINLGVGLNFTSPDFNLDGTPEFGAGAVITGLRDWVSAGWGWNFGVDAPYTFVGFNIPFTVAGFGSSNGSVQGNGL